ncbi:hypothetical protein M569_14850, partial [Genlisea aurea]
SSSSSEDHQLVKVIVPRTDENLFGPGFVEVENQSGLSNFIPILVGDRETCSEMETVLENLGVSSSGKPCDFTASALSRVADFVLEVGWLLKEPAREPPLGPSEFQRFNALLKFLIENESSVVLRRLLSSLNSAVAVRNPNFDLHAMLMNVKIAEARLAATPIIRSPLAVPEMVKRNESGVLQREVVMDVMNVRNHRRRQAAIRERRRFVISRPAAAAAVAAAVVLCAGACVVVLHPLKFSAIAVTVKRCLFDL